MSYKFAKIDFSYGTMPKDKITYDYGVDYDSLKENEKSLFQIAWHGWTSSEIQRIIDKSKEATEENRYEYQVEGSDLIIVVYPDEVYFFDWHTKQESEDFKWSYSEFIDFMEKFKTFIEENN
ncbi:putative ATPase [Flavobacterium arsenatis]|uniref:ATPase n=1 Tax=Flavobacterium arsenatis TaxID=1484332 RepID=A0ABU1TTG8_9FLAO|nr:hypothetical protein [Flavobacterium arsenatis]MDR6969179.1 putative ATPase [Flavobacterium arsenatis]